MGSLRSIISPVSCARSVRLVLTLMPPRVFFLSYWMWNGQIYTTLDSKIPSGPDC